MCRDLGNTRPGEPGAVLKFKTLRRASSTRPALTGSRLNAAPRNSVEAGPGTPFVFFFEF